MEEYDFMNLTVETVMILQGSREESEVFPYGQVSYGFKTGSVIMATIMDSRILTKTGSHKTTMEISLEVGEMGW